MKLNKSAMQDKIKININRWRDMNAYFIICLEIICCWMIEVLIDVTIL